MMIMQNEELKSVLKNHFANASNELFVIPPADVIRLDATDANIHSRKFRSDPSVHSKFRASSMQV